jgi:hypothetical protein
MKKSKERKVLRFEVQSEFHGFERFSSSVSTLPFYFLAQIFFFKFPLLFPSPLCVL